MSKDDRERYVWPPPGTPAPAMRFGPIAPQGPSNAEKYGVDPAELEKQMQGFYHGPKRKPDIIDQALDQIQRWNLMTPEQRAAEVRAAQLDKAGYAEVSVNGRTTVVKKSVADEMKHDARDKGIDFTKLGPVAIPDDDDDEYYARLDAEHEQAIEQGGDW